MGIFTRGALDKIFSNSELSNEQRVEQIYALYGRSLDEGYVSKQAAEDAKTAAVEAAKAGFKPEPIDPKTTEEYKALASERDMLRAIGGDDFAGVKPKFRLSVSFF